MHVSTAALVAASLVGTTLLTFVLLRVILNRGALDVPNERSSHTKPTPRGGGIAIVVVNTLAMIVLYLNDRIGLQLLVALGGGLAVSGVGLLDDRRPVGAGPRLLVHFTAALWALFWLGGVPPLQIGGRLVDLGIVGDVLGLLGIVWTLNFFNFMDGIDGIAASEGAFICGAAVCLGGTVSPPDVAAVASCFAACCCGFLAWNWPPARVFLGDVGSGYLGYVIAVLALAALRSYPAALWVWLILTGVFFVDATVTVVRRALRGESPQAAHRTHAYQWLTRRWGSHAAATLSVLAVNLFWLLPCALMAAFRPEAAATAVVIALAPLVLLALWAGAGRREPGTNQHT